MDHSRIDGEQIIDRYLVGRLAPEDEKLFEEHLFECAQCLEKVEAGEHLRRGLRQVAAEDTARVAVVRGVQALGLMAWLRGRRPGQLAGLASLGLALLLLPIVVLRQQAEIAHLREQARRVDGGWGEPTGDFLVVSLGTERGRARDEVVIRPDPDTRVVLLSLELQEVDSDRYRVTLTNATGELVWRGENLAPNLYDTLLVALPPAFLAPGSYRVAIESVPTETESDAGKSAGEMVFRIVAES